MAVNPVQFLVASNASITDGSKIVSISGNVDCSRVYSGTAVFLGGADNPAEAVSGTSPDGSGNSTITLRNNWSQGDIVNQQMVTFNTNEGLAEAISNVREIVSNASAIEDLATQGLIKRIDDNTYEVVNISSQGESLITANDASSQRSVMGLGSAATRNVGTSAGNVMEVGTAGVASSYGDVNNDTVEGTRFFRATSSNNSTLPSGVFNAHAIHLERVKGAQSAQIFFEDSEAADTAPFSGFRVRGSDGVWGEIVKFFTDKNSVNPLDHGIGRIVSAVIYPVDDLDSASCPTGFYSVTNNIPQNGTRPAGLGIYGYVEVVRYDNGDIKQEYTDVSGRKAFRVIKNGVSENWQLYYHSGNTNFNEFGGEGGDVIAFGVGVSSTELRCWFALNSTVKPSSVSFAGSFAIRGVLGQDTSNNNVTTGNLIISSNKFGLLSFTELSGLTENKLYRLQLGQSNSRITFNF